ncbi:exopolysaccharide biosynthesis polyprenyl glycosylphosphotransferase [Sinomonas atrocyanea]|uniref:sugar transferase n=1 Tax=Sinomonas atrocyanea TaxID=37927 RepID=UPI00278B6804|nr:sugar transferase [Sinomonas atrocyanea]MDP9885848.1 exopolysaccharide biosynthesis polyprenyl glycosylphosphotransferase [Sinomonas atrocyanea]
MATSAAVPRPTKHLGLLGLSDLVCIIWATVGAQMLRFGSDDTSIQVSHTWHAPYALVTVVVIGAWWLILGAGGTRESTILGHGPEEYKRVLTSSLWLFGAIAILSYVFGLDTARGYVAVALPLGIISLLISRWVLRSVLVQSRSDGRNLRRVLVLGAPSSARHLARQLADNPGAGYRAAAAYLPGYPGVVLTGVGHSIPVLGHQDDVWEILAAVTEAGVDTVAISGSALAPEDLRRLGWELAARNVGMILAPALTDVAGPRIHMQPVGGLPLIHVTTPKLEGGKAALKRGLDIVASLVLLAILGIPMLLVAAAVKLDSPGPALFRQTRVGRAGISFKMLKFRSMVVDAEARLAELRSLNEGAGLLFKMKQDPRVTRLGRILRRFSIDELPQLINVLRGEMSLVGPRPPLPAEVAGYDDFAHRRLLVKPGVTGLWQVSGRSDLSWEEAIRLDLSYVENWSLVQDLVILLRTARAVLGKSGAY